MLVQLRRKAHDEQYTLRRSVSKFFLYIFFLFPPILFLSARGKAGVKQLGPRAELHRDKGRQVCQRAVRAASREGGNLCWGSPASCIRSTLTLSATSELCEVL